MTEKRYTYSELNNCQYSVSYTTFNEIYGEENVFYSRICEVNNKKQAQKVVDLLNEQEETIQTQKDYIIRMGHGTIFEEMKRLKERNQRQYKRLKEITDLMFKRDWKTLELMVDEWEKEEEQLQKYGG